MIGFQGRRILVSGAESSLGGPVVQRLLNLGTEVITVEDLADPCFKGGIDTIIFLNHTDSISNDLIEEEFIESELSGLVNLLRFAGREGSYFIYASSAEVYGRQKYLPIDEDHPLEPVNLYGAAKLAGENFCRAMALENCFSYCIIRFGCIYGPGKSHFGWPEDLLERAVRGRPLVVKGKGGQVRSYLYIDDAVEAVVSVIGSKKANQVINVAGTDYISAWHLANIIKQKYSASESIIQNTSYYDVLQDEIECCIDSGKAVGLIGFKPKVNLLEGLGRTYKWLSEKKHVYRCGTEFAEPTLPCE